MAKRRHISAVISLKDNMSPTMQVISREQRKFQNEVRKTRQQMQEVSRQKISIKADAIQSTKTFKKVKELSAPLRQKLVTMIATKDMATAKIKSIAGAVKGVGRLVAKPVISAIDKTKSVVSGVMGMLGKLGKGVLIPVTMSIAGGVKAIGSGMALEQQQISMNHFMGVGNKGKSGAEVQGMSDKYLKDLRNNANATPFQTNEVIQAGTRALQIAGGDPKEAMNFVKLAEDMAALNPTKTVSDAMEALADTEMGEFARLTEFGVKATKEGGDTPETVQKKLQDMYTGGAEKLSTSGAGLWSTIKGKIGSAISDTGLSMVEGIKPGFESIIGIIDTVMPKFTEFGNKIGEGVGIGVDWLITNFPMMKQIVSDVVTELQPTFDALKIVGETCFNAIRTGVELLLPVFQGMYNIFKPIWDSFMTELLPPLANVFGNVFGGISGFISNCWNTVEPILSWLGGKLEWVIGLLGDAMDKISYVTSKEGTLLGLFNGDYNKQKKGKKAGTNATGTPYWGGGLTWVGEHGKELIDLPVGTKIHSNSNSKNQGGGGDIYQITVTGNYIKDEADANKIANVILTKLKEQKKTNGGS